MNISKMFGAMSQFLSEAFARIFSPSDDTYPEVGEQPFSGDLHSKNRETDW